MLKNKLCAIKALVGANLLNNGWISHIFNGVILNCLFFINECEKLLLKGVKVWIVIYVKFIIMLSFERN